MQDVVQLSHLDGATHEVGALVNELILNRVLLVATCVAHSLNIGLDFTLNDATHFARDWIAIFELTVNYSRRCVQGIQDGFATVLSDTISRNI